MSTATTLYSSPGSQHCRRVLLLIKEADMDIEIRHVDVRPPGMGGENESDEFLALNPNGKVPVLTHGDDIVLTESNAIMYWLCENFDAGDLWPGTSEGRAEILMWQFWQAAQLTPAADGLMVEQMGKPMFGQTPDPDAVERLNTDCHRWLSVLDRNLADNEYITGNTLSCADLSIAAALMYTHAAQIPIAEHAHVAEWFQRIQARDSWQASQPPPMPMG